MLEDTNYFHFKNYPLGGKVRVPLAPISPKLAAMAAALIWSLNVFTHSSVSLSRSQVTPFDNAGHIFTV